MTDGTEKPASATLLQLPGQKNEVAAAGENIRRHLEDLINNQRTLAKIRRAAFLAYVDEGFTEAQALDLCCK
jgi:hypothetical protein